MTDQDKKEFQIALCALWQTLHPRFEIPIETQRGYFLALSDLSLDRVKSAISKAARECKFFPRPAELRELCKLPGDNPEVRAIQAWSLVIDHCVGNLARGGPVDFADPVINSALRAVGGLDHIALQGTTSEHEKFTRPRFIAAYLEFAKYETLPHAISRPLISRETRSKVVQRIAVDYLNPNVSPRIEAQTDPEGIAAGLVDSFRITGN